MSGFLNISREECLNVYPTIIENAEMHFRVSQILAKSSEFGVAISHLVLGSEELVKAVIIFCDGIGFEIRKIKGAKLFFGDHQTRHLISFILNYADIFIPLITAQLLIASKMNNFIESNINLDDEEYNLAMDKKFGNLYKLDEADLFKKMERLQFWTKADEFKMRGFYVDYNQKLSIPSQLSEFDFNIAMDAFLNFKKTCFNLIEYWDKIPESQRNIVLKSGKNRIDTLMKQFFEKIDLLKKNQKSNRMLVRNEHPI
jgi:AbiV family abortive infection protein